MSQLYNSIKDLSVVDMIDYLTQEARQAQLLLGQSSHLIRCSALTKIAESTGGKYFRATDNDKLKEIYEEINALETAKIETIEYEVDLPELAYLFIGLGLLTLMSSFTINTIIFKSVS